METDLFNDKKDSFWMTLNIYFILFYSVIIRLCRTDLILIYRLSDYSLCKVLKLLMQMFNSLIGRCVDIYSDCNALSRDGYCHSYPYAALLECPIACAVPCGKCFTI